MQSCEVTNRCVAGGCPFCAAAVRHTAVATTSRTLPAAEEAAIEPVPEQIGVEGAPAPVAVRHRHLDSGTHEHVVTLAQRHLQLRDDVPLGARTGFEGTRRDQLEHRRPLAMEAALEKRASGGET